MKNMEQLYYLHKDELYRYLLSLTGDPDSAGDLLQETFLQAMLSIPRFRGDSSVRTWLFAIGRNLWYKSLRKKRETAADIDFLERYLVESFEEFTDRRLLIDQIGKLVEQKDERTQAVFRLRTEGYSYAEIGERVGISENSARVMEHRLRLWLKKALKEEELQ